MKKRKEKNSGVYCPEEIQGNSTHATVLPFNKKISDGEEMVRSITTSICGPSWMDDPVERKRIEELGRHFENILASAKPRDAASAVEQSYLTDYQFKLLQWAEKQMEIRRLQRDCESILTEIEHV